MTDYISSYFIHILIAAVVFIPFELALPRTREQKTLRKNWSMDTVYAVLGGMLSLGGYILVITIGVVCFAPYVPAPLKQAMASQHIILQVVEIALISDLWYYFMHRLCHRVPILWRFHAIHHSIEDMDWLAAHRVHPVDQVLTSGIARVLPILLGFSSGAFAAYTFLLGWHSLLKHSNVKIGFGPFSRLIASPTFHHWHHANEKHAYDKNFAGVFPFLDIWFGTALINEAHGPEVYGVDDPLPEGFSAQLITPFLQDKVSEETASVLAK